MLVIVNMQLLKRNYTMQGYQQPKILKLPQGEMRWAPRRLPVDIGDVMMSIRMDEGKNKYIGENISKYAQGLNPYGEWGYPYKVNKNNIRPPIIDPKFYQPLSRMPVKFDAVTAGPIIKDLYTKQVEISKVAPKTIMDRVAPNAKANLSDKRDCPGYKEGSINLHLKQPRASLPYHPTMPVHMNTGVPDIELQGKMIVRPQMGIHGPFNISDQSRDVYNMRTPMHVALRPGYKDPYTTVLITPEEIEGGINETMLHAAATSGAKGLYTQEPQVQTDIPLEPGIQTASRPSIVVPTPTANNINHDGYDLAPKIQTSAWYNPSYSLNTNLNGYSIGNVDNSCLANRIQTEAAAPKSYRMITNNAGSGSDVPINVRNPLLASRTTNVSSRLLENGKIGDPHLKQTIGYHGQFDGRATVPTIEQHQTFNRVRDGSGQQDFFFVGDGEGNRNVQKEEFTPDSYFNENTGVNTKRSGIRNKLQLQGSRIDRTNMEPPERVIPIGTGRFIYPTL